MAAHLTLPLALTRAGAFAEVPVDSLREVTQSTAVLLATRPGERTSEPLYGSPDPIGRGFAEVAARAAISRWEPRASDVAITTTGLDVQAVTVQIGEVIT